MKISEQWLREWVNPKLTNEKWLAQLTQGGFEMEAVLTTDDGIVFEFNITPNRGDCLSAYGFAREAAALTKTDMRIPFEIQSLKPLIDTQKKVHLSEPKACPYYCGIVIENIDVQGKKTPDWIAARLKASDLRLVSPVVDIANYVMLELGQPMHAFDLNKLTGDVGVRFAKAGEKLVLLDEQEITLTADDLVVSDQEKPIALAGIMGSANSCVDDTTTNVFLESAFFDPVGIRLSAKHFGLHTDASYRFERGVDPYLAERAIRRFAALLLETVGGKIGPLSIAQKPDFLPANQTVLLRASKLKKILGIDIPWVQVKAIFEALQFECLENANGLALKAPSFRFDIEQEEDLIEEVARIYGYDNLPAQMPTQTSTFLPVPQNTIEDISLAKLLQHNGYCEAITYSFISEEMAQNMLPDEKLLFLKNPISQEMNVMRPSLWPGLLKSLTHNTRRQQERVRLFEQGLKFVYDNNELKQQPVLAGIAYGLMFPEQWGKQKKLVDFFDVKADIERFLQASHRKSVDFKACKHVSLHPKRAADIYVDGEYLGVIGELHPRVLSYYDLTQTAYVFECDLKKLTQVKQPRFNAISKFPHVRRDLSLVVSQNVLASDLKSAILECMGDLLAQMKVFDVYQGKGIEVGMKSIGLGLVLQHPTRTLLDSEVDGLIAVLISKFEQAFGAKLRS